MLAGVKGVRSTARRFAGVCVAGLLALSCLPSAAQSFGVYRELWTNLSVTVTNSLNALTNATLNPNWPTNPATSFTQVFTNFEMEVNTGRTNYGQRVRGYVVPPFFGNYTFWIASDDASQLSLSSDENPSNASRIAWVTAATTNRQWTKATNQQSQTQFLEAGRRYYIEAQMQQGPGLDNLAVRCLLPNTSNEAPMLAQSASGTLLIPYTGVATSKPAIYRQPTNTTAVEAASPVFTVVVTNPSAVFYQWRWGTTNIAGATKSVHVASNVLYAMNGATFRCVISNAAGVVTSSVATLTVQPAKSFGVFRELWNRLSSAPGNSLNALTNTTFNPNWPARPDAGYTAYFTNLETEVNTTRPYFGQRMRTLIVPPTNGLYTFWIASDDTSALFLSSDESPTNSSRIAWVSSSTGSRVWTAQTNQRSAPVYLEAGRRYYVESQMQQSAGNDHMAVRWQLPSGSYEEPLTATGTVGTVLMPFNGLELPPAIYRQPTNLVVPEGVAAAFVTMVTNRSPMTYQWFSGSTSLAGAVRSAYAISNAIPAMNGLSFRCVVSNAAGVATSVVATLTVVTDTNPPAVVRAFNVGLTNVQLVFSERIETVGATNPANFAITNGPAVLAAALEPDGATVTLGVGPLTIGSNYWIAVQNIRDRAVAPNTIASNTTVSFQVVPFTSAEIGYPAVTAAVSYVSNGVDVTSSGGQMGATATDQLNFNWQYRDGDFDVAVRLAGLPLVEVWSKAGLMARVSLDAGCLFAASVATPSMNGDYFEWRSTTGQAARMTGRFPANQPDAWLRLRRVASNFTGYASFDGLEWTQLGSADLAVSNRLLIGLFLCAKATNVPLTVSFREYAAMTGAVIIASNRYPRDVLGPTSRKTPIVFSEIHYKPAARADSNNTEFIELHNTNPWFHDIGGYRIEAGGLAFTFPTGTVMAGGSYLCIAASPSGLASVYGVTNAMGPYTGSLKKADSLKLYDEADAELLSVSYDNELPWPVAAYGTGHSLILANPTYGENDPRAWDISSQVGGTPGALNVYTRDPLDEVVINEVLAHTDLPQHDTIELYNHGNATKDLSGAWLSNDPLTNKYRIPDGTLLPPRGFAIFTDSEMGFRLDKTGDQILLVNSNRTRVIDAISFEGQQNGVSLGRVPDGGSDLYRMAALTLGTNNGPPAVAPVVINELMYKPISGEDDDQYVELFNRASSNVDLSGWSFTSGIDFVFPSNTVMTPGSYLVVARDAARLRANHAQLNYVNCLGNFAGRLSGGGERVALSFPHTSIVVTNGTTNATTMHIPISEVTYGSGGRWGLWSAGGGSSLELIDADADTRLPSSWADSDETAKSDWTNVEATGVLELGSNYGSGITNAQLGVLDVGECLIDDVEIFVATNPVNLVRNPSFETGLTNWIMEGNHVRSSLENSGYNGSSRSLHVRGSGRMWVGANSCEFQLNTNTMAAGQVVTMRYKARWLHGWPEIYLRLCGNWLEAFGPMPVPANLGTPGLVNSRAVANAPPALYNVAHRPAVPAAGESVVVTACVQDPDGVTNLAVNYRIDPATNSVAVAMVDDGTAGDAIAGDGVFSALLPGQASNKVVAFTVTAADGFGATNRFPELRNLNEPARECVVLFGDGNPSGSFGTYHLWMTTNTVIRWMSLPDLSNESHDCTMVSGNRVIYNMVARYSGSPYHQGFNSPAGNLCHYKWTFNDDDKFLGATSFNKIHQPGNQAGDDTTIQREQLAHTFMRALGVTWLNRRYAVVYVNGNRRGTLMEDAQTPDSDVVEERWPDDSNGWLYKMQPWFEFPPGFTDAATAQNKSWCHLNNYIAAGGVQKPARYRWDYMVRSTPGSASDYSNVYALVAAASAPSNQLVGSMKSIADMENWMRVFAANHAAGNWDSFGARNGQNLYGYIGQKGTKYSLLMWDYNIVLGHPSSSTPGANLFETTSTDTNMARIYQAPEFRRMYWRALQELVRGPLDASKYVPLADAKYATFFANGLTNVESPNVSLKGWMFSAQTSIAAQVAAANTTNFAVNPSVTLSNNLAFVSGSAPFDVKTILIGGIEWPLTWTSVTGWTTRIVVPFGTSTFAVAGVDIHGLAQTNSTGTVTIVNGSAPVAPEGVVVFNEIMYATNAPGGAFVEFFNTDAAAAFALSGWEVNGLGYTFPPGSVLGPRAHLTLVADERSFVVTYGASNAPFDTFSGQLADGDETLSLLIPGIGQTAVVDRVRYEFSAPWADTTGMRSLQLVAATNDNSRVSNWAADTTNRVATPGQTNTTASEFPAYPTVWLNEVSPSNTSVLADNTGQREPWVELYNAGTVSVSLADLYLSDSYSDLTSWAFPTNATIPSNGFLVVWCDGQANQSTAGALHSSFRLAAGSGRVALSRTFGGATQLVDYLNYTNLPVNWSYGDIPDGQPFYRKVMFLATPGATNNGAAPAATVAINEWMADNTHTILNPYNANKADDWFELYNYGDVAADLSGFYLTDKFSTPDKWMFPSNSIVAAGGFLFVWADGLANLTTEGNFHVPFKLSKSGESIGLFSPSKVQVDTVTFGAQQTDITQGRWPDGAFNVYTLAVPTPGSNNIVSLTNAAPVFTNAMLWLQDEMTALAFDAHAVDFDLPAQTLTYALVQGPAGLTLDASSGLISWLPGESEGPSTSLVVLTATDNGWPAKVATQELTLVINEVNRPPEPLPAFALDTFAGSLSAAGLSATDPDIPANELHFSLAPAAPTGAVVDTETGVVTWTPTDDEAGQSIAIPVVVTDDGVPALSSTGLVVFNVQAYGIYLNTGLAAHDVIRWNASSGVFYRVEFSEDLAAPFWQAVTNQPVTGDGVTDLVDPSATNGQRFYRLRIVP